MFSLLRAGATHTPCRHTEVPFELWFDIDSCVRVVEEESVEDTYPTSSFAIYAPRNSPGAWDWRDLADVRTGTMKNRGIALKGFKTSCLVGRKTWVIL
jgi:hypothetical protein